MRDCIPFWQIHPCPPWCAIKHTDTDHVEDRIHRPDQEFAAVPLTVNDPIHRRRPDGSAYSEPPLLRVDMEQHTRETSPRISLRETNSVGFTLTGSEALQIGRALVRAGQLANETA
ncbi:DUF6907 domain-containing protein [Amycolatopsis taiwanensis]|uniref:Uncharacterized protein n=1 Tax=Amycolatopsis taiwanensis TaxID=342230 RepID=A0A9W6QXI5_9PSEU|nr:hypothetical protein [Amycolatopsis taiwanensis]GLY65861.1 hypothetical protein Atai01_24800 [Amycolatopsis taiwanensis]